MSDRNDEVAELHLLSRAALLHRAADELEKLAKSYDLFVREHGYLDRARAEIGPLLTELRDRATDEELRDGT